MMAGMVPGEIEPHSIYHEFTEMPGIGVPHPNCSMKSRFDRLRIEIVENVAVALRVRMVGIIRVEDRIGQAAGISHDGYGAVL